MNAEIDQSPTETLMAPVLAPTKLPHSWFAIIVMWILSLAAMCFALSAFLYYLYRQGQPLNFVLSMILATFVALIVPIILTMMFRRIFLWRSAAHTAMLFLAVTALLAIVFGLLAL
ncbi:MAG: hypothetical protein HKM24_03960 [Gammaproteobacteria bacterium]|nr:hypothetical protein [Gammaproteobacteria bacterium]